MLLESPLKNSGPYDKSSWDIFGIRPFSGQNRVNYGGRKGPRLYFLIGISLLCYLEAHVKIQNSTTSLSRIYLKLADFPVKIGLNGGSPNFFFLNGILLFLLLGAHTKIWNPMISLSGIYLKIAHFPVKIGLIGGSPKFVFH